MGFYWYLMTQTGLNTTGYNLFRPYGAGFGQSDKFKCAKVHYMQAKFRLLMKFLLTVRQAT